MSVSEFGAGEMTASSGVGPTGAMDNLVREGRYQLHLKQNQNFDKAQQKRAYEFESALNREMHAMQSKTIAEQVAGLKQAGLSPTMASGSLASGSSGGGVSAPVTPASEQDLIGLSGMALQEMQTAANIGLMQSEARHNDAESEILGNESERRNAEDRSVEASLYSHYNEINNKVNKGTASDVEKVMWGALKSLAMNESLNKGTLNGMMHYQDYYGNNYHVLADAMEDIVRTSIFNEMDRDKSFAWTQKEHQKKQFDLLIKNIVNLSANTALLKSQKQLTDKEKERIEHDINRIDQDVQRMQHDDIVWLWNNDRIGYWTKTATTAAEGAISGLAGGIGFGGGLRLMKSGAKKAVDEMPKTTKKSGREDFTYDRHGRKSSRQYMEELSTGNW